MIDVTCAIIRDEDDRILVVQRGEKSDHPFKWEFPGGKIRDGETYADCIIREIREELSMGIVICSQLEPVEYDYGFKQVRLIPFVCDTLQDEPVLKEHIDFRWVVAGELRSIDFQEADVRVMELYLKLTGSRDEGNGNTRVQGEDDAGTGICEADQLKEITGKLMSLKQVDWLAASAIENQGIFGRLLEFSFGNDSRLAFRSSWVLTKVCDKQPEIIRPHLPGVIRQLRNIGNNSVVRSFMRILSQEDMNNFSDEEHGFLTDYCLGCLNNRSTPVAIKAYAMEILYRLTVIYPGLGNEAAASIRANMEAGQPGVVSKGRDVLRRIMEITGDS